MKPLRLLALLAALPLLSAAPPQEADEPSFPEESWDAAAEEGVLSRTLEASSDPFALPRPPRDRAAHWPERNPFLFPQEQETGLTLAEIAAAERAEQERQRRALEQERERERAELLRLQSLSRAAERAARMRVTAVMIGRDDRRALVDGRVVREGERVPGTDLEVVRVTPAGLIVRAGGEEWVVLLPPPGERAARSATSEPEEKTDESYAGPDDPEEPGDRKEDG